MICSKHGEGQWTVRKNRQGYCRQCAREYQRKKHKITPIHFGGVLKRGRKPMTQRNNEMKAMRKRGMSYADIAFKYLLSRQRAWAIINDV